MKYTLSITGLPRTGTTTLWRLYGQHPQISRSKRKEPLQIWNEHNLDNYIDSNYFINKNTKILLDGSTNVITYKTNLIEKVKQLNSIERLCCIYTLRDPIRRTLSQTNNFLRNYLRGHTPKPIFLNDDLSINYYHLNVFFRFMLDEYSIIKNLENSIGTENILFIDINRIFEEQKYIFSQLGINEDTNIKDRTILNRTIDLTPSIKQLQIFVKVNEWFKSNKHELEIISKKTKDKILKEYYRGRTY